MTVETTEYAERKARVIGEDGEIFDSVEEYAAWVREIEEKLARSAQDKAAGRVISAAEAKDRFLKISKGEL
jgi:toxin-antitoxin system, antitoxin component